MWYPGKFWRNISYVSVHGELGDELGHGPRTWRHRLRYRMAMRRNDDYLVAVPAGCRHVSVEGWSDTVDHRFGAVTVRCGLADDRRCWIETWTERSGATFAPGDRRLAARSGPLSVETTELIERTISIVQAEDGTIDLDDLRLIPLSEALAAA